jgi:hypothetical protein
MGKHIGLVKQTALLRGSKRACFGGRSAKQFAAVIWYEVLRSKPLISGLADGMTAKAEADFNQPFLRAFIDES